MVVAPGLYSKSALLMVMSLHGGMSHALGWLKHGMLHSSMISRSEAP